MRKWAHKSGPIAGEYRAKKKKTRKLCTKDWATVSCQCRISELASERRMEFKGRATPKEFPIQ